MSDSKTINLGDLLAENRQRLVRMIQLRLDKRLSGRVDASDVIQDAFLEATHRFDEFLEKSELLKVTQRENLPVRLVHRIHGVLDILGCHHTHLEPLDRSHDGNDQSPVFGLQCRRRLAWV